MNGDHNGEELKKEIDGTTDVNGNEGPEAKKKKLEYTENSHKNEMVGKQDKKTFLLDFKTACLNPSSGLVNRNLMNCKVLFA